MDKIVSVSAIADGCLKVTFSDGRTGEFDVKPFMRSEFFAALRDQEYFAQVGLFFSGVGWPGGQDLGPDTISAQLFVPEHS
ncbi:MAG: DUF2442 domain-containing protein [Dechloromonas sp.]|uniref:DUF2442 domain-containing protein n=1 Tax=Candidatus Dechloromonas phosphorivorans TaxID=2899244 RepID=A0A9D7LUC0_9RHOO|nr:DUF2442 domain-containing protein [Candidatus Dechloromonas phosphorivorans]